MDKEKVKKVLAEKVAPRLAADGGGVELVEIRDDNVVVVKLTGACGGCPFSTMTLKAVVEELLKAEIPEIEKVVTA
ncbi:MAG: NifU family protein [Pseudomonadota bacterium]